MTQFEPYQKVATLVEYISDAAPIEELKPPILRRLAGVLDVHKIRGLVHSFEVSTDVIKIQIYQTAEWMEKRPGDRHWTIRNLDGELARLEVTQTGE